MWLPVRSSAGLVKRRSVRRTQSISVMEETGGKSETPGGLLHVVGHDHDGVVLFGSKAPHRWVAIGSRRGAGLVHQQDLRLVTEGPSNTEPLLLAPGESGSRLVQTVLTSSHNPATAEDGAPPRRGGRAGSPARSGWPVRDVVEHGLGKGFGAKTMPTRCRNDTRSVRGRRPTFPPPGCLLMANTGYEIVEAIDRSEEGGFSAPGRADDRRDGCARSRSRGRGGLSCTIEEAEALYVTAGLSFPAGRRREAREPESPWVVRSWAGAEESHSSKRPVM